MRRWSISQGFALGVITRATLPILALVCGAVLSAIGTSLVRRKSAAIGFVDMPGGRKAHVEPVPLGGGIAITLATLLPIVVAIGLARIFAENPPSWMPEAVRVHLGGIASKTFVGLGIVIAAVTMCAIGLADDARPMQARVKLLGQFLIALFLVVGCDLRLMSHLPGGVSIVLSVFWILTLTNSFNFLDNMDGLAGGVGMIAAAVFASTAFAAGRLFCASVLRASGRGAARVFAIQLSPGKDLHGRCREHGDRAPARGVYDSDDVCRAGRGPGAVRRVGSAGGDGRAALRHVQCCVPAVAIGRADLGRRPAALFASAIAARNGRATGGAGDLAGDAGNGAAGAAVAACELAAGLGGCRSILLVVSLVALLESGGREAQ